MTEKEFIAFREELKLHSIVLPMKIVRRIFKIATDVKQRGKSDVKRIIDETAFQTRISYRRMKSKKRTHNVFTARVLAMNLIKLRTNLSQEEIGKLFNRDHATVIYAEKYFNDPPPNDVEFIRIKEKLLKTV